MIYNLLGRKTKLILKITVLKLHLLIDRDVPGSPESNRNESKILGNLPGCSTQGFSTTDDLHKEGLTKNYVIII